jgi:putative glutamine amidotransferase
MPIPLIGITTNRAHSPAGVEQEAINETYVRAVAEAGGLPVLIPVGLPVPAIAGLLSHLQGVLLSGGGDIDPQQFNGASHPRVYDVITERDALEIDLVLAAVQSGRPFLGICRGAQVVNVALGGTLYTHILDQLPGALDHEHHAGQPFSYLAHRVEVAPGSRLAGIMGAGPAQVNSLHHQGICDVAPGLEITARASDGLVEAAELKEHPFGLTVQWHPEWLPELAPMRAIFRAFVQAADGKAI